MDTCSLSELLEKGERKGLGTLWFSESHKLGNYSCFFSPSLLKKYTSLFHYKKILEKSKCSRILENQRVKCYQNRLISL